jgi:hypothetical protein
MAHNKRGRLNVCGYDGEVYWGSDRMRELGIEVDE